MKIEITGEAKEIAVLALELQRPQPFNVPNKDNLVIFRTLQRNHLLSVLIVLQERLNAKRGQNGA